MKEIEERRGEGCQELAQQQVIAVRDDHIIETTSRIPPSSTMDFETSLRDTPSRAALDLAPLSNQHAQLLLCSAHPTMALISPFGTAGIKSLKTLKKGFQRIDKRA